MHSQRVNRWIQNHQKSVLARHAAKQPQTSSIRSASRPSKRHRSKNARDMAKLHDETVQQAWKDLSARVKDEEMSEREKWKRYNAVIREVLADEALKEKYTAMADEANLESSRVGIQAGQTVPADFSIIPFVYVHHIDVATGSHLHLSDCIALRYMMQLNTMRSKLYQLSQGAKDSTWILSLWHPMASDLPTLSCRQTRYPRASRHIRYSKMRLTTHPCSPSEWTLRHLITIQDT